MDGANVCRQKGCVFSTILWVIIIVVVLPRAPAILRAGGAAKRRSTTTSRREALRGRFVSFQARREFAKSGWLREASWFRISH